MDSDDWEPPTKAEMKLIEARRERSDKISKLMSGYLLKGYKMLGSVCSECETILLQDRQGTKYCVTCSELDSDTDKDNPLTNQAAAKSMVKETELSSSAVQTTEPRQTGASKPASKGIFQHSLTGDYALKEQNGAAAPSELYAKQETIILETGSDSGIPSLTETQTSTCLQHRKRHANMSTYNILPGTLDQPSLPLATLFEKIDWASKELKDASSVEYSIQLCHLIKAAAEAVVAVRGARM